ncbi:MAG: hypothetical protein M1825_002783 [Sarcosagium campestre]|nr:MAG: hypothetical protein M1825_002783 [Sarcosagium campestre]
MTDKAAAAAAGGATIAIAALWAILPTAPVAPPPVARQLTLAHANPLGQHPPLSLAGQGSHPEAHVPPPPADELDAAAPDAVPAAAVSLVLVIGATLVPSAALSSVGTAAAAAAAAVVVAAPAPSPVGATMTMPLAFLTVDSADAGQEVRPQSRPTRQHPPR